MSRGEGDFAVALQDIAAARGGKMFRLACAVAAAGLVASTSAASADDKRLDPATLLLERVVRGVETHYIAPVAPDDFAARIVDALNGAGPGEAAMVACEKEARSTQSAGAPAWLRLLDAAVRCARGPAGGGADADARVDRAIARALARLDPDARYHRRARATGEKVYWLAMPPDSRAGVVGLLLRPADAEGVPVHGTVPGAGGAAAGVRAGDKLLAIDGRAVAAMPLDSVMALLVGEAGSSVELRLRRASGETVDVRAVRSPLESVHQAVGVSAAAAEALAPTAVKIENRDGILILSLATLVSGDAEEAIRNGVKDAVKAGRPPAAIVLDLRYTRSGEVAAAQEVADLFLDHGIIARVVGRDGSQTREAKRGTIVSDAVPVFVIQSDSTSGAGAIIAAALLDDGRATTIGQPVEGTGIIKLFYPVSSDRAINIPEARIYRANGRPLSEGLQPSLVSEVGGPGEPVPQAILDRIAAAAAAAAARPRTR